MELTRVTEHDLELIHEGHIELIRSEDTGQEFLKGYAVVWYDKNNPGTTYRLPSGILERVDRHAFDEILKRGDNMEIVYGHEGHNWLGDTKTQTAFVEADEIGLKVTVPIDKQYPQHLNVKTMVKRSVIKGMSFEASGLTQKFRDAAGNFVSIIKRITSIDNLSFEKRPAYKATTADFCRSEVAAYDAEIAKRKRIQEILTKGTKYV
jgi:Phage head maturation protease